MLIDWKQIAADIYEKLKKEVSTFNTKPCLSAVLVWDSPSSLRYIRQKRKWAEYIWIDFNLINLSKDISEEELLKVIIDLNNDEKTSWYIVQLPLPKHIDEERINNAIDPKKDVDWFHPINQWKILIWDNSWFVPCTPAWIIEILKAEKIDLVWKEITVIWKSNIVWKPVTLLLINSWATVTSCNSKTKDLTAHTKKADIIVVAVWIPGLLKENMLKKDSVIIDVWFSVVEWKIYWDAETNNIDEAWHRITPVPWWVWVLTVAMLMSNTLKAYKNNLK